MPTTPTLITAGQDTRRGATLAVYAPFGSDDVLSTYPDGASSGLAEHPLYANLLKVAATGVEVTALIDLAGLDTYLVDIPAGRPAQIAVSSRGKLAMDAARTLSNFLQHAHERSRGGAIVLALEGHGAGFMPDLDVRQLTFAGFTAGGSVSWRLGADLSVPFDSATGKPLLASGSPVLPAPGPTCPLNHPAMSTYALGAALQAALAAGAPRFAAIHFNNCFNMSVEVLHTVAPYADFATGYCNYNFFTAGEAYPAVFERLATAGAATAGELARWFAEENHRVLSANGHEPTVGCTVELARLHDIVEKVDDLSDALLAALRTSSPAERPIVVDKIRRAIVRAQQYDSRPDFILETPDELTDLDSLATELRADDFSPYPVHAAADALRTALAQIKVYGDRGTPWMAPDKVWDFTSKNLAMNIFLPDPLRKGLWDWRSQYYLDVNPDPNKPQVQRQIIDFVKVTDWVDFLIEYHRDVPFVGLLPAQVPEFPILNRAYKPPRDRDGDDGRNDHDKDDAPGTAAH